MHSPDTVPSPVDIDENEMANHFDRTVSSSSVGIDISAKPVDSSGISFIESNNKDIYHPYASYFHNDEELDANGFQTKFNTPDHVVKGEENLSVSFFLFVSIFFLLC